MNPGPLQGVTVLDLTRVLAGPYCTMMLSELGARIIKVEPPGGDDSRQFDPFVGDTSAYFGSLNRGKESIVLNLKCEEDRTLLMKMVKKADVLIENYRAGTLERLGLGWEKLQELNPRLIYASVSGFGHTGPWSHKPAYDMIVQALGGLMSVTGQPGTIPTKAGTSIGDITGGLFGLAGVLSALYHRATTGKGIRVDVSMLDGQVAILESAVMRYLSTGTVPKQMGNRHPSISPFDAFQASDRLMIIAIGNDALFCRMCQTLGTPELMQDERFKSNRGRNKNHEELKAAMEAVLVTKTAEEWIALLDVAGVPCSLINTVSDALALPQIQARNMVVDAGPLKVAGNPVKFDAFTDPKTRRPASDLDADGPAIRREFQ